jgi:transcriptional regulator with XRE-family HTH domain
VTREIVETLKRVLKARSMTYADLAVALRVSTPTVKRLFSQRTFTLERLEEILKVLEMDFFELARMSHGRRSVLLACRPWNISIVHALRADAGAMKRNAP